MNSDNIRFLLTSASKIQSGLIILIGLALLLPGTRTMPLLDRDEPRFAQATIEMIERNEWIIPYFNGEYRFDKPVLTYWIMRIGYCIFGKNELGARIHSIISTILIGLVVWWAGRRWFSARIGFAAAVGLLTCLQFIINGRSCVADMLMVLSVTVSQVCLYELLCRRGSYTHLGWILTFYLSLGLGFLAKGPVALLVPALSAVLFRFIFWRRPLPWSNLKFHIGIPLMLIVISSWGVPALLKTQGLFWKIGMNEHVVKRGIEVFHGRLHTPVFYLVTAFISLFPWIAFAGEGWHVLRSRWRRENAFLVAWFTAPYLIFSFYATQLPHYVMPGFAAFFLIMAQSLEVPLVKRRWTIWWFRIVTAIPAILAIALFLFLIFIDFSGPAAGLRPCLLGLVLILVGLIAMSLLFRYRLWTWIWIGIVILGMGLHLLGGGLRKVSPAVQMVPIFEAMPPDTKCLGYRFTEGSMVFYSDKKWKMTNDPIEVKAFLEGSGSRLAVVLETEKRLDRYLKWIWGQWTGRPVPFIYEDYRGETGELEPATYSSETVHGLNLGKFTWVTIRIFYRVNP
jgi:4-amino-4-deoxy-L-arabinose transferase-like glycosyltransferase